MHSNLHAVCALLAQGADCSIQDAYGVTAFDRAAMMFIKYTKSPGRYARPNSGPCSAGWRWSPELVGLQSVAGLLIKSQTLCNGGDGDHNFSFSTVMQNAIFGVPDGCASETAIKISVFLRSCRMLFLGYGRGCVRCRKGEALITKKKQKKTSRWAILDRCISTQGVMHMPPTDPPDPSAPPMRPHSESTFPPKTSNLQSGGKRPHRLTAPSIPRFNTALCSAIATHVAVMVPQSLPLPVCVWYLLRGGGLMSPFSLASRPALFSRHSVALSHPNFVPASSVQPPDQQGTKGRLPPDGRDCGADRDCNVRELDHQALQRAGRRRADAMALSLQGLG